MANYEPKTKVDIQPRKRNLKDGSADVCSPLGLAMYLPHAKAGEYKSERVVAHALDLAGVEFTGENREDQYERNLDFYLPDYNTYIEVKSGYSKRSRAQLKSQKNVILIQGLQAAETFARLITR